MTRVAVPCAPVTVPSGMDLPGNGVKFRRFALPPPLHLHRRLCRPCMPHLLT